MEIAKDKLIVAFLWLFCGYGSPKKYLEIPIEKDEDVFFTTSYFLMGTTGVLGDSCRWKNITQWGDHLAPIWHFKIGPIKIWARIWKILDPFCVQDPESVFFFELNIVKFRIISKALFFLVPAHDTAGRPRSSGCFYRNTRKRLAEYDAFTAFTVTWTTEDAWITWISWGDHRELAVLLRWGQGLLWDCYGKWMEVVCWFHFQTFPHLR